MLAAKDSKPVTLGERGNHHHGEREVIYDFNASTLWIRRVGRYRHCTHRKGAGSGAAGSGWFCFWSRQVGNIPRRGQPKVIAYTSYEANEVCPGEIWVELEVSPGVYGAPEDDSYGVDFVVETLNQAYPGCTGLYLDVAGHMVAFYGKKGHSKAGLLQGNKVFKASQAIAMIPTWMGYPATWRVRCVSVTEASEIVTACKRLERENWRRAR